MSEKALRIDRQDRSRRRLRLEQPPHIQPSQAKLQGDEGPGVGVKAPGHPKDVAEQEYPEARIAFALCA